MSNRTLRIDDQYFATLPIDLLIQEAHGIIGDYYEDLRDSGLFYLWEKSYRAYYGARLTGPTGAGKLFDSSEIQAGGKSGELLHFKINHYRSLLKHTLQLATSTKPAFACRATNGDYKSQTQAILGNGLIDYYMREKKLIRILTKAVEIGLVFAEGWVHSAWDATGGEKHDVDEATGRTEYEGDLRFGTHSPLDVVRDIELQSTEHFPWLILRESVNKFEEAAKYPDLADRILNVAPDQYEYERGEAYRWRFRGTAQRRHQVTRWTIYHEPTDAVKDGRLVQFIGDIPLVDGPLPYSRIPLHAVRPDELLETPYGYSPAFDILGPQQGLDILNSTIMTNNGTFGVQSVWTKRDDQLTVTTVANGMKNLQSDEKPEAIQLTQTAPETFNYRNEVIGEMETLAGISATVRGNPEANLKSGSALALVVSQSVQFASMLEGSYNALVEDVGTDIIMQLRDFSTTDRVATILGESARPFRKEFTSDDLDQINRVVVEAASPLSKTIAGRIEMANDLLEKGMIETPKQYVMVLTTGQLDPAIEGVQHEMLNIRAENEDMRNGEPVVALITDLHEDHIREHKALLANPEARANPEFVNLVLDHIQSHINEWRNADPAILMITGQNPPPPPMMPPGGPGAPMLPDGAPAPDAGGGAPAPGLMQPEGPVQDAQMPGMPSMPSLPADAPEDAQAAYDKVV
jgi:hypothetical protein